MKNFSKIIALVLCMALALCGTTALAAGYTAGTYEAEAQGNNGAVKVSVTFSDDAIVDIQVVAHAETAGLSDAPIANIPGAIVDNQSLAVDTVSGATNTSNAILNAVAACVELAGGDVEALKNAEVAKAEVEDIDATYDVVIVGGGGAGLTAAITAAQNGCSVVLIEKGGALGGNTLIAGQGFNAADPARQSQMEMDSALVETLKSYLELDPADFGDFGDTLVTVQGQINDYLASGATYLFDTPELHMLHCYMGGTRTGIDGTVISPDLDLIDVFCHSANDALNWLESIGGGWNDTTSTILGAMWPRSHGLATGNVIPTLQAAAEANGVVIMLNTAGKELLTADGVVNGIYAESADGAKVTLHANKGVVMATGGFAANAPMVVQYNNYWPGLADTMPSTNSANITGDGIVMAQAIGADVTGMGFAQLMPSSHPVDGSLFTGIWGSAETQLFVNKQGVRYVNEYAERDVLSKAALEQEDGLFFIIADKDIVGDPTSPRVQNLESTGCVFLADTLEELAEKIGVPADALVETVNKYNEYTLAKNDPDFGKELFGQPIDEAPFCATPRSPSLHHTMGGLKIDTETHVLNVNGEIIPGLYAAGEVCGGIHAGNRLGGNAMTDFLVFGRIAGENAAQQK